MKRKRWGEVTIKKQGVRKNAFDGTKSFSIDPTENDYSIEQYRDIMMLATDLTSTLGFRAMRSALGKLAKDKKHSFGRCPR